MKNALDIFTHHSGALKVAVGESHTTGERQFRVEVLGNALRIGPAAAKELAQVLVNWADASTELPGTGGGDNG